ncbi:MAG: CHAD domain-containing protein [Ktedonobacteraceae bacterium]
MKTRSAPMCAAIDVGSNTIHIVVARCFPDTLEIVADEVEMVRIGESVTATGAISPAKSQAAIATLQIYQALAAQHGATRIFVVATEAIRQASNSSEFIATVKEQTGLEMQLISGAAEAALTFFGATYEAGEHEQIGVMDLGGGSLELAFARKMHLVWRTSLPIGSGWLHDRYLSGDPPTSGEIEAAETFLQTYLRGVPIKQRAPTLIVTGGSANSLCYLVQEAFHRPIEPRRLSLEDLARCQGLLSALETTDIANLYKQPLARARILLAGTLIIAHVMRRLQIHEIVVSPHGIREGVLLAYARFGENWLGEAGKEETTEESFAQSARTVLLERLHTMLEWPAEVLKHEDIEAVHKMRVASRRLRAALDAYQSCCDRTLFKKVYRKIKKVADALGEARDTDVMLHHLYEQLENVSEEEQEGVRRLVERLHAYRQQKQQELTVVLSRLDGKKLEDQIKACVREGTDN